MSTADELGVVLVTGASGFTGSTAVDYLLQHGYPVLATDLPGSDFRAVRRHRNYMEAHPGRYADVTLDIVAADLTERSSLKKLFEKRRVQYIMHPAAIFDMSASRGTLNRVNVGGTCNLLDTASIYAPDLMGVAIWSTVMLYGGASSPAPITEDKTPNPVNNYSESKLRQEEAALEYERDGMPLVIIRPASVYGPRGEYAMSKALTPLSWGGIIPFITIPGSGNNMFSSVHIDDVVGAAMHLIYCLANMDISGQVFNVADNTPNTFREMFEECASRLRVRIPIVGTPDRLADAFYNLLPKGIKVPFVNMERDDFAFFKSHYVYDNSKLAATGYVLKYPETALGMKVTLEWYARNKKLERIWYITHPKWRTYWPDIEPHERTYADYDLAHSDSV